MGGPSLPVFKGQGGDLDQGGEEEFIAEGRAALKTRRGEQVRNRKREAKLNLLLVLELTPYWLQGPKNKGKNVTFRLNHTKTEIKTMQFPEEQKWGAVVKLRGLAPSTGSAALE